MTALTNESSNWDSTISSEIDEDQLKTINTATQGTITLVDANKGQALSGTAANLLAALTGISNFEGNITFEDDTNASDVLAVVALTASDATFTGTAMRRISGSASDVFDALTALGGNTPSENMTSVTLSGIADASDISAILDFGFVTDLIGTGITAINGSSTEVKDAIADLDDSIAGNFTSRITGKVVPADLKAVNDATGEITIVAVDEDLSGSTR